jgi:hypothetical protein
MLKTTIHQLQKRNRVKIERFQSKFFFSTFLYSAVGLAIAGEGGVASSKPVATAVVGPGGLAVGKVELTTFESLSDAFLNSSSGGDCDRRYQAK